MTKNINYLNNRDLLEEIHKSKKSFSSYTHEDYQDYDIILQDLNSINIRKIAEAKRNRADRLSQKNYEILKTTNPKTKLSDCQVPYKKIKKTDVVFRIMTFDHIPDAPGRKKTVKTVADSKEKVNFPPFQHWKFDENDNLICVGKSHWSGGVESGHFSTSHGQLTNRLALMYMKLCERYATKGNVRNYCVDQETTALTNRGWLGIDEITTDDLILSCSEGTMKWSSIKSIFKGDYTGDMHHITANGLDSLVSPGHKILTTNGLLPIESLADNDELLLMGNPELTNYEAIHSDDFVKLIGLLLKEYSYADKTDDIITISENYENEPNIRSGLNSIGANFTELTHNGTVDFNINISDINHYFNPNPEKLDMDTNIQLILSLTTEQREVLINTAVNVIFGRDDCYTQPSDSMVNMFQSLCALSGIRTEYKEINNRHIVILHRHNQPNVQSINFNGGYRENNEYVPVTPYSGKIWCPETEYGCFVARRNGCVYITGNSYNDEMKDQALVQLIQVGLQFNESKSSNPFAYLTSAVINSFVRILNEEKKMQDIRDDILQMNNMNPSYSRLIDFEFEQESKRYEE